MSLVKKISNFEASCYDSDMELTNIYADLHKQVTGYMLNTVLDFRSQEIIQDLQQKFNIEFADAVYSINQDSLHITLMDWVAPLVDYKENKEALFNSLFPHYDTVFREIIKEVKSFHVTFDTIGVSSEAIFLIGHDEGQFRTIRDSFTDHINLVPGTKQPPTIIHTSIIRFTRQIDIKHIEAFASTFSVQFTQNVNAFRLVNEKVIPMLQYDVIKTYKLN